MNNEQPNKIEEIKTNVIEPTIVEKPIETKEIIQNKIESNKEIEIKIELIEKQISQLDDLDSIGIKYEKLKLELDSLREKLR